MFYILYGEDDFSVYQTLEKIKAQSGNGEMLAASTSVLDGEKVTFSELKDNCNASPFLAPHRLVIVNHLLSRFESGQSKPGSGKRRIKSEGELGEWEDLASYIKQMPETTVLVMIEGKLSRYNPLLKRLSPIAEVRAFPFLRGGRLKNWVQQQVISEGGSIAPGAVNLLAELIGGDLWAMSNEIRKLVLYAQGRSVTEDDVKQLVTYSQEASIFSLVDAILERQTGMAQRMLHVLYQQGATSPYVLTMITRQFRLIALAKEIEPGLSRLQIQDRLGLTSSYSLDKTLSQARLYDFEQIRHAYDELLETDVTIKAGKYNDQLALELLVAELSCPRA